MRKQNALWTASLFCRIFAFRCIALFNDDDDNDGDDDYDNFSKNNYHYNKNDDDDKKNSQNTTKRRAIHISMSEQIACYEFNGRMADILKKLLLNHIRKLNVCMQKRRNIYSSY